MSAGRPGLDPARTITIVSGLPRSGTSMMMQMLEAAGFGIASDGRRVADRDNPKGYYELDAVKRLREDASCLGEAVGRAVKVIAPLLPSLSGDYDYRVIFVERALDEVLASQRAMLDPKRVSGAQPDDDALKRAYENQLSEVKSWLAPAEHENGLRRPLSHVAGTRACRQECGGFHVCHRWLSKRPESAGQVRLIDEYLLLATPRTIPEDGAGQGGDPA